MRLYKLCKTEQSAARQRELEAGLLAAMNTRRFEEISVSDLCDQLGVPRKSFYRYFSSKDGALQALLDHTLMEYESSPVLTAPNEKRTIQKELERFFRFWLQKKPFLDVLQRSKLTSLLIQRAIAYTLSGALLPRRFLPQDTKEVQEQIVTFTICGLMSIMLTWHEAGYLQSPQHMARLAVRLVSQPLFPNIDTLL
jgi:AcrR family transcriptional regulator